MGDGKTIVVEHYPVDRLPDDLRARLGGGGHVRLVIEASSELVARPRLSFVGSGQGTYRTPDEAVAAIRELRKEWE